MRLRDRILRAAGWTLGGHVVEMFVRLLTTLIMTRLLFPEAYGQIALSTSIIIGLTLVSDFGVHVVIMQNPRGDTPGFLRSAWTFQLVRGLAIWSVLAAICTTISLPAINGMFRPDSVFASAQFAAVTMVLGAGLILAGLESTAIYLNARRLNLRPLFLLSMSSQIVAFATMVTVASLYRSVWALVAGALAAGLARLVLSHIIVPGPRMYLRWDKNDIREITLFGRWLAVSSIGTFISGQSDQILLGLLLPSGSLGLYAIAKLLADAPLAVFDKLSASLTIPAMREVIQHQPLRLKEKFYQLRLPFDLLVPLIGGALFVSGPHLVNILYDRRYAGAGHVLQLLAVGFVTYPALLFGSLFAAAGEPRAAGLLSIFQAISLVVCITIGYYVSDFSGAVWGVAVHKFAPAIAITFFAQRRNWFSASRELRCLLAFAIGVAGGYAFNSVLRAVGSVSP